MPTELLAELRALDIECFAELRRLPSSFLKVSNKQKQPLTEYFTTRGEKNKLELRLGSFVVSKQAGCGYLPLESYPSRP